MRVRIDSREIGNRKLPNTRKERAQHFFEEQHQEAIIEKLEYGDYQFADNIIFEYKTIVDLMSSISNSSVFEEVANQTLHYDFSFLIIVGSLRKWIVASYFHLQVQENFQVYEMNCHIKYNGALRRLRTFCNIITCKDEEEAFNEMLLQARKCLNAKSYAGVKRSIKTKDAIIHALCGCNGVSEKKAEKIKQQLNITSLKQLSEITKEELLEIEGIGEKTAEKIVRWLK